MALAWLYPNAYAKDAVAVVEDTVDVLRELLDSSQVEVLPVERKAQSPAVCGAEFVGGSRKEDGSALLAVHSLVLDVDQWGDGPGYTPEQLADMLKGVRAVWWTSFSSTRELPKYRVVIPLSQPMPPSRYYSLCALVNRGLGHAIAPSTFNPGRLGFCRTVGSETAKEHYRWGILPGSPLDWTVLQLQEESVRAYKPAVVPADKRPPDWLSDAEALRAAKRYFAHVGKGVVTGNRHETLLVASCQAWWEWAAPDDKWVREVLDVVNANFKEPKIGSEVAREVHEGHKRTLGDSATAQDAPYGVRREPLQRATLTAVADLAKRIKRKDTTTGTVLERITKKARLGSDEEARTLLFGALEALARGFPREAPDRLFDFLRQSLGAQRANQSPQYPLPTDEECLQKLRTVQNGLQRKMAENEAAQEDNRRRTIRRAFATVGQNREDPYSAEELAQFAQNGHGDDRWIVQHGGDYYVFLDGQYVGPFSRDSANSAVHTFLAPVGDRIKLRALDKQGNPKMATAADLVREGYGTLVLNVTHSLVAERDALNADTLVHAIDHRVEVPAVRQPIVEQWLNALVPNKMELAQLQQWMVSVTDPSKPANLLVLEGPTGVGKSLLACGLAGYWDAPMPTPASEMATKAVERCPLVYCDENVPREWRKDSAAMRAAITHPRRTVAGGHYENPHDLTGYMRFMLCVNDLASAVPSWGANPYANEAIAARMLRIRVSKDAGAYLKGLTQQQREAFVRDGLIAQHVAWLRDQGVRRADTRFGVDQTQEQEEDNAASVLAGDEQVGKVLASVRQWVEMARWQQPVVVVSQAGEILVQVSLLMEADPEISRSKWHAGKALAQVAPSQRRVRVAGGDRKWYRALNVKALEAFVGADTPAFVEALAKLRQRFVTEVS